MGADEFLQEIRIEVRPSERKAFGTVRPRPCDR